LRNQELKHESKKKLDKNGKITFTERDKMQFNISKERYTTEKCLNKEKTKYYSSLKYSSKIKDGSN
jgi:hypothetical protein